jgi:hypothetical protein
MKKINTPNQSSILLDRSFQNEVFLMTSYMRITEKNNNSKLFVQIYFRF